LARGAKKNKKGFLQVPQPEKETPRLCRDDVRKAKAQLELNLARGAKKNKKGFSRYLSQKREIQERVPPQ